MIAQTEIRMVGVAQIIPLLSLTGVVLNALGGLYLAYELLGAKRGPLRLLSRVFTYSAIFGLGYAAMLGLWFGLSGALVFGPTIEFNSHDAHVGFSPGRWSGRSWRRCGDCRLEPPDGFASVVISGLPSPL
jgi:hypothetical protein